MDGALKNRALKSVDLAYNFNFYFDLMLIEDSLYLIIVLFILFPFHKSYSQIGANKIIHYSLG